MPRPGEEQRAVSKFIIFEDFEKMNTQSNRQGLPENQLSWIENLQPISANKLVTLPAPAAAALASFGAQVQSIFYGVIGGVDYLLVFPTDGSAVTVNVTTGFVNQFALGGTFSNPDATTWQAARFLISDPTAGYCSWDGTLFIGRGSVSPVIKVTSPGSNYSSPPPVNIIGGSGAGAAAVAVISAGTVISVNLTSPGVGYKATDVLSVVFGTGVGSGATGHVTMTGFPVAGLLINNAGSFQTPNAGTFALSFSGGGGAGAAGTATVVAIHPNGPSTITGLTLTSGGTGYTSVPAVTLATTGGTPPVLSCSLGTESVATIVLDTSGAGYVTPPTVTITGGGGSGATAHSTISNGIVTSLVLDAGGSGYTATPQVFIGTGTGAAATAHPWNTLGAVTTLAVFKGRVWLAIGNQLTWTGTGGFDDFTNTGASGSTNITDADLVHSITALRSFNNYLWIMGDQSTKQIGNISLDSTGLVTLFTILTLSSDQGTLYPRSCFSFNRLFGFVNNTGVYAALGSSVQKISDDLDGIFKGIDFSLKPQSALADVNNVHLLVILVKFSFYNFPLDAPRPIYMIFDGKRWFVAGGLNPVAIATAADPVSGTSKAFMGQGTSVTQLFADPTTAFAWRLQTSLTHHGNSVQRKKLIRHGFTVNSTSTVSINNTAAGSFTVFLDTDETGQSVNRNLTAGFQSTIYADPQVAGKYLGMTVTGNTVMNITSLMIEYQETNIGNKK